MFEGNATGPILAALGFAVGMVFWGSRRAGQVSDSSPSRPDGSEPEVRVTGAEFLQVAQTGLSGIFYEPTMDFRLRLENQGAGLAVNLRARVSQGAKYYWIADGGLELEGSGGALEIIMRCRAVPPLGQDLVTWVEMPLRLEYGGEAGGEWYTEVPVRLKLQRHTADTGAACWWVDVMAPQIHGRATEGRPPAG